MTTYLDKNRNHVNGSQRETSICTINDSVITFNGYQNFTISEAVVTTRNEKIKRQFYILKNIDYSDSNTIIDIGCSNGFFAFSYLSLYPDKHITFMDHDTECINNIQRALLELDKPNYTLVNQNFNMFVQNDMKKYDTILMLSIIHWLYSCTTTICCLNDIIENVRNKNNKQLVIEWVDNDDCAIKQFNHISYNPLKHKSPYNLETFLKALNTFYNKVEFLGYTNKQKSRSIYMCSIIIT